MNASSKNVTVEKNTPAPLVNFRKIFMITPTYKRNVRKAELTRLGQTLMHVPNFHWILVEDAKQIDPVVGRLLQRLKLNHTYLNQPTEKIKDAKAKGFSQRNRALKYLSDLFLNDTKEAYNAVVYFGDDDNTYDLRLFEAMRSIEKIGVWPVALCGGLLLEKLIINETDQSLINFDVWLSKKSDFRVDMAGFAINAGFLFRKGRRRLPTFQHRGLIERAFLRQVTEKYSDVKPLNFFDESFYDEYGLDSNETMNTEVLVWHTKTKQPDLRFENNYAKFHGRSSDFGYEI
uniref:Galactosylgalactosylxylosylprotein 3-beta-glucuronosyltransferase n=1 Tax=Romanomermis culicivorax TaxID=13658 RepID=A0A915KMK8_ROMCU